MILPMKRISLVVMEKEREESLKKLRSLGVLRLYASDKKKKITPETLAKDSGDNVKVDPQNLVTQVLEYSENCKRLQESLVWERNRIAEWE